MKRTIAASVLFLLSVVFGISAQIPVSDPGPRGGTIDSGGFLAGLTASQLAQAQDGQTRFVESESVPGGLGPRFNGGAVSACGECHSQPAEGGSSPSVNAFPNVGQNPQVTDATFMDATNQLPFFVTANGPIREARFAQFPDGTPDNGVHDIFTITGRTDAGGCTLTQPNFVQAQQQHNLGLRIPLQTFGDGLIENIGDETILANMAANQQMKQGLGISGHPNRAIANMNGNDSTISRFGWKAQNQSLLQFAGEAYNVEVGVTNEMFPVERPNPGEALPSSCILNSYPEDQSNPQLSGPPVNSDITAFAAFMRVLAPPTPATPTPQTIAGQAAFVKIGCALCHTPSLVTEQSSEASALSGVQANLFSDLLVHHMGQGLADGITQGAAGPDEFRTTPLWGIGQRVFFLHDGRTSDLLQAIRAHASSGSEANGSISLFNNLSPSQQQDVLNFLRSL
jgi:cytochrome c553